MCICVYMSVCVCVCMCVCGRGGGGGDWPCEPAVDNELTLDRLHRICHHRHRLAYQTRVGNAGGDVQGCVQINNYNTNTAVAHDARSAAANGLMDVFVMRDREGIDLVSEYIRFKYPDLTSDQVETMARSKTYRCAEHSCRSATLLDDMRALVDASTCGRNT